MVPADVRGLLVFALNVRVSFHHNIYILSVFYNNTRRCLDTALALINGARYEQDSFKSVSDKLSLVT